MSAGELATAEVLITDCQTTGSTPESGHLLEAGWTIARASDPVDQSEVHSALARLPDGEVIPNRISRLTGVTMEMMLQATPPEEIWRDLVKAAKNRPVLAHYARFEERFYRHLHQTHGPAKPFPLQIICTHRIAARLLPDLPRRGMRALAGYFGHPLPEMKRAGEHVRATLFIWSKLADLLGEAGVVNFDDLAAILARKKPARGKQWTVPLAREERLALADGPGIYRFINAAEKVIYVGKATSLKSRVNSYFRRRKRADKELEIISQAARIETEATRTSLEAALLEAAEIKRHDPLYNTALRDTGRGFGTAEEVAALAAETGYLLGRPCAVTDTAVTGNWFRLVNGLAAGRMPEDVAADTWQTLWLQHYGPCDLELFHEGTALFLERHGLDQGTAPARMLRSLGRDLWLEMRERQRQEREARAAGELEAEEEQEDEEDEEVEVTAEIVAGRLTGLTMSINHQMRKGRWLALLAGAEVSWDQREGDGRRSVTVPEDPPDTLVQYDLLRVLTTELRRLIRDGRNPIVTLPRGRALAGERLYNILELV